MELINNTSEEWKYRARAELLKILREYRQPPQIRTRKIFSLRAAKSAACAGFAVVCEKRDFADLGGEIMRGRGRENLARKFRNCLPISAFVPPHKFSFFCADCAARNFYSFPPAVPPAPRSGDFEKSVNFFTAARRAYTATAISVENTGKMRWNCETSSCGSSVSSESSQFSSACISFFAHSKYSS